jgi:putative oxidoreductase
MKGKPGIALITYALFFLFVYTSLSKLMAYDYYLYDLSRSPLLGKYSTIIATLLPVTELLIAGLLLPDKTRKTGFIAALVLLAIFTAYVSYVLIFTTSRPCTCGGIIRQLSWPGHLLFNILFLILTILGICYSKPNK